LPKTLAFPVVLSDGLKHQYIPLFWDAHSQRSGIYDSFGLIKEQEPNGCHQVRIIAFTHITVVEQAELGLFVQAVLATAPAALPHPWPLLSVRKLALFRTLDTSNLKLLCELALFDAPDKSRNRPEWSPISAPKRGPGSTFWTFVAGILFRTNARHRGTKGPENEAEAYLPGQLRGFGLRLGTRLHVSSFRFQIINHKS
jgi:hypothetical protein